MSRSIVVMIEPDGKLLIEAVGFKGNVCSNATKALEQAMGTAGKREKKNPDWYVQEVGSNSVGSK